MKAKKYNLTGIEQNEDNFLNYWLADDDQHLIRESADFINYELIREKAFNELTKKGKA